MLGTLGLRVKGLCSIKVFDLLSAWELDWAMLMCLEIVKVPGLCWLWARA